MSTAVATDPNLLCETQGGVCRITLNRPAKRNALSHDLLSDLETVLAKIAEDNAIRVVVLAAAGPVFSSGHDLKEMTGCTPQQYRVLFGLCSRVMQQFRKLPQPVIARVQGLATAAGCQLVAACDLAVAVEEATFATPGVKIGLFCTTPMVPLVRAIPAKPALEMLLTGKPITAKRACELGLVNRVVPAELLDAAVQEFVDAILASSPPTVAIGKRAFYEQLSLDEETAYERATEVMSENAMKADAQEGMGSVFAEAAAGVARGINTAGTLILALLNLDIQLVGDHIMTENDIITIVVDELRALALAGEKVPAMLRRVQHVFGRTECGLVSVMCFHKAFGGGVAAISPIAGWCGFGGELSDAQVDSFLEPVFENYRESIDAANSQLCKQQSHQRPMQ